MKIRRLAVKGFDYEDKIRDTLIIEGAPYVLPLNSPDEESETIEVPVELEDNIPYDIKISREFLEAKDKILDCPLGDIIKDEDNNIRPLSQLYAFKFDASNKFGLPSGTTFANVFESDAVKGMFVEVCKNMFPNINPLTNKNDIDVNKYYAPYIPLVVLTGIMTAQKDENDKVFFNPEGTVSVAEFLDCLNAIKFGANSNVSRKKTLDNISDENDYFNEGYQKCLRGISSPFFNLYRRDELVKPITRFELAYITVICWTRFIEKFDSIYSNPYYIGINFDWEHPYEYIKKYLDGRSYKVSKVISDKDFNIISLNIKDYKGNRTMTTYKNDIKVGTSAIPLPMFMSLIELDTVKLFNFKSDSDTYKLDPLKEVSRGELCYFVNQLAKIFNIKYC